ncbi:MAG: nucleotidyltransferase domain-containing protein [Nanoarchaeota archaeon]|nr:nucleotidyltransferase domain-containing protein [Nanoarchaeota archaeon]
MRHEIIKQAFKLGNSAGVLLPNEWRNKKVLIKLIEKSITEEIFEILEENNLLKNTIGIFLAGSYARGEETEDSDIDVLVITDNFNKQIKNGKYEIVFISKDRLDNSIMKSIYLASLISESKAILNGYFLELYKNKVKGIFIKKQLDEIKSMTGINEKSIEIDKEMGEKVPDETIYSVVLRLREIYLIESLKNNKDFSNKEFLGLIRSIASEESYNAYLRIKNNLKPKQTIAVEEAMALIDELKKRIRRLKNGKKKQKIEESD